MQIEIGKVYVDDEDDQIKIVLKSKTLNEFVGEVLTGENTGELLLYTDRGMAIHCHINLVEEYVEKVNFEFFCKTTPGVPGYTNIESFAHRDGWLHFKTLKEAEESLLGGKVFKVMVQEV